MAEVHSPYLESTVMSRENREYIKSITNKKKYCILKYASTKCIDHGRMLHTDLNILT